MPICRNCGVQIDEGLERCPLCRAALGPEGARAEEAAMPEAAPPSGGAARPFTRRRLWEIVSLLAAVGAAGALAADFAYSRTVSWARYPLVTAAFLWATGSLLIFLRRRRLLLLLAQTAVLAAFLLGLDLLLPGKPWFLRFGMPVTVLAAAFVGGVAAVVQALWPKIFSVVAVGLACAGLFAVGLEAVINLYFFGVFRLGWSLVVFGCSLPLVGLLLYVQYRLKVTQSDIRRIFHV